VIGRKSDEQRTQNACPEFETPNEEAVLSKFFLKEARVPQRQEATTETDERFLQSNDIPSIDRKGVEIGDKGSLVIPGVCGANQTVGETK
jgi:hypothetical protein